MATSGGVSPAGGRRTVTATDARPVAPALSVTLATSVWIPAASVVVTSDPAPRSP